MINKEKYTYKKEMNPVILMALVFFILISMILLSGCSEDTNTQYDRFMTELESPVILIGKTDKAVAIPSIVVKDCKGRVRTFAYTGGYGSRSLPSAIADSREIGDTLK